MMSILVYVVFSFLVNIVRFSGRLMLSLLAIEGAMVGAICGLILGSSLECSSTFVVYLSVGVCMSAVGLCFLVLLGRFSGGSATGCSHLCRI